MAEIEQDQPGQHDSAAPQPISVDYKIAFELYRLAKQHKIDLTRDESLAVFRAWRKMQKTRNSLIPVLKQTVSKKRSGKPAANAHDSLIPNVGATLQKWANYKPVRQRKTKVTPAIFLDGSRLKTSGSKRQGLSVPALEIKHLEARLLERRRLRENWGEFYISDDSDVLDAIDSTINKASIWSAACDVLNGRQRLNPEYFGGLLARIARRCHSLRYVATEWHNLRDICVAIDWVIFNFDIINQEHPSEALCFIWHSSGTKWDVQRPQARESVVIALFAAWLSYISQLYYASSEFARSAFLLALATDAIAKAEYSHDHCANATMVWMVADRAERLGIGAGLLQAKQESAKHAVSQRKDQQLKPGWIEHCKNAIGSGVVIAQLNDLFSIDGCNPDFKKHIDVRTLKAWATEEAGITFKPGRPKKK